MSLIFILLDLRVYFEVVCKDFRLDLVLETFAMDLNASLLKKSFINEDLRLWTIRL